MKGVPYGVNGEWNLLIALRKRGVNRRIRIESNHLPNNILLPCIDSDVWTNPIFAIRQRFQIQFFHDILARGECKRNPTKGEIPAEESITIDLHIRTNTESSQILPHYEYLD
jgi:hypothetical protein